ncbi:MAG: peptidoglycan DD-metalloendopeptidase family protein [Geitlerinemataceae cyanobacterium]
MTRSKQQRRRRIQDTIARWSIAGFVGLAGALGTLQTPARACGAPVLDRLTTHTVGDGETLDAIASRYGLSVFTLTGFNPALREISGGALPVGSTLQIPPYNGLRVRAEAGDTWRDLADRYNVRADILFEQNGCETVPETVFIPGATRSPVTPPARPTPDAADPNPDEIITTYPLAEPTEAIVRYGWVLLPGREAVNFHSGIDLVAAVGDRVVAAGDGTVAFAGERAPYGNLVVVNHANGRQTRYGHLGSIDVAVGETIRQGEAIGTVGQTGNPDVPLPHLHFELRSNSALGWIADDPQPYLDAILGFPRSPLAARA